MKPVTVTTTIDRPREEIHAVLDDLMNHEAFTDVSFTNESGPAGVGDWLAAPVIRAYLRRQNGRALERLKEQMEAR